jgi:PPOX class probable F420-dependent enzyme
MIDLSTEFGTRVVKRLGEANVIWLTTISPSGTPQPNPVWFLWENGDFLIYTQPKSLKVRNISKNPKVSLNLDADEWGGNVVIFTGEAHIDPNAPPVHENAAYVEKYREGIADIQMTPESMAQDYRIAIRVTPKRMRGF